MLFRMILNKCGINSVTHLFFIIIIFSWSLINFLSIQPYNSDVLLNYYAANNIIDFKGFSLNVANSVDAITQPIQKLTLWPPFYSFLLTIPLSLGIKGIYSIFLLDVFFFCYVTYLFNRCLVLVLAHNKYNVLMNLLFFTSFTPFGYSYSGGSNLISIALVLQMLICILKESKLNQYSFSNAVFFCISAILLTYTRYQFIIPVFLSLFCLIWFRISFKRAVALILISSVMILIWWIRNYNISEQITYLENYHPVIKSLHYNNLLNTTPFISNSLFYSPDLKIENFNNMYYFGLKVIIILSVNIIMLVLIISGINSCNSNLIRFFVYLFSFGLLTTLILLSIYYPMEVFEKSNKIEFWTYVQEARYFGSIDILFLLFIAKRFSIIREVFAKRLFLFFLYGSIIYNYSVIYRKSKNPFRDIISNVEDFGYNNIKLPGVADNTFIYNWNLNQRKGNLTFISGAYYFQNVVPITFLPNINYIPLKANLLIPISRKYVSENEFKNIQNYIMDNNGEFLGFIDNFGLEIWRVSKK